MTRCSHTLHERWPLLAVYAFSREQQLKPLYRYSALRPALALLLAAIYEIMAGSAELFSRGGPPEAPGVRAGITGGLPTASTVSSIDLPNLSIYWDKRLIDSCYVRIAQPR